MQEQDTHVLSVQGVKRLPYYLKYLKELQANGTVYVPAGAIAESLNIYEVQVRKDLAAVSSQPGKPRVGFSVDSLISDIEHFLGYDCAHTAALVGVGHLGKALMSYSGFADYGLNIAAAFDCDPALAGRRVHDCEVYPMERLEEVCRGQKLLIGIIATPASQAQIVCDALVRAGVRAIWNFAHVHLHVPGDVLVQNEDMAVSFALLSSRLAQTLRGE
ncbi:MAG: redox-sensing transcriptional repressor Rex [Clostridia bacterium]|nr:redox-sensing transcriptional repressor Rex [Clostridia bacterium]